MKSLLLAILLGTTTTFACPGAGTIGLSLDGEVIGYINEYESIISLNSDYNLNILSGETPDSNPDDGIEEFSDLVWICDERTYTTHLRTPCKKLLQSEPGVYSLPTGYYDLTVNVKKLDTPNAIINFIVPAVNLDPNQPRARSATCGKTVEGSILLIQSN